MDTGCDVSVVISTRNRSRLLVQAIASVLEQDAAGVSFELIVVDNGSDDDTAAAIRPYLTREIPVRYLFEPKAGVSNGRNAGILAARGSIVAFTDDDVLVGRDWVAMIKRTLDERPDIDCVGGRILARWVHPPPSWLDRRHWSPLALVDYGSRRFEIGVQRPLCLLTSNMALRRSVCDRIGMFSPQFTRCQDHELQLRYWRSGGRALYVPELVVVTEVPAERMMKGYHRAWHRSHGTFCALMRLTESIAADSSLLPGPIGSSVHLWGSPAYLYRALALAVIQWLRSTLSFRPSAAFESGNRLRYLSPYLRKRRQITADQRASSHAGTGSVARALAALLVKRLQRRRPEDQMPPRLTRTRLWFVHALITFVVAGHVYDIVRDQEHWPFSPYPMFATIDEGRTHGTLRVFGIASDAELPLLGLEYIHPLDQCRLSAALKRIRGRASASADLREAARDIWARYEARRRSGEHAGPPLDGVRLYALQWRLDPRARNAQQPDEREMLVEFRPDPKHSTRGFPP